jgi:membrane-associated protease RseP (regulator of RpoE activity)
MDMEKLYIFLGVVALSWILILVFEKTGRLKAERHLILLIVRTEQGKEFISRLARHRRFWRVFGSAGILVGFLGMLLVMYSIVHALYSKYVAGAPVASVQAVIPGVTIPFWYGLVGLVTVLVVHEIAHGIVARSENISLKSLGLVFVTIIPIGAFVEPDEEELKNSSRGAKLRVYAVGSFGNILLALLALLGFLFVTSNFFDTSQVQIIGITEGSPADGLLREGMIIQEINGAEVTSLRSFFMIMRDVKAGDTLVLKTDEGLYTLTTAAKKDNPEQGYMGVIVNIAVREHISRVLGLVLPMMIYSSLYWIFLLNQGIGLINLAPLHLGFAATDGHHMLRELLSRFIKEGSADRLSLFISGLTMLAILFTVVRLPMGPLG